MPHIWGKTCSNASELATALRRKLGFNILVAKVSFNSWICHLALLKPLWSNVNFLLVWSIKVITDFGDGLNEADARSKLPKLG